LETSPRKALLAAFFLVRVWSGGDAEAVGDVVPHGSRDFPDGPRPWGRAGSSQVAQAAWFQTPAFAAVRAKSAKSRGGRPRAR